MTPKKLKTMLRRLLPYKTLVIQCDADTTPESLAKQGMVCAIVTWVPMTDAEGNLIEEGFHLKE